MNETQLFFSAVIGNIIMIFIGGLSLFHFVRLCINSYCVIAFMLLVAIMFCLDFQVVKS